MLESDAGDKKPPPQRGWLRKWTSDEAFWRDVTSQALSGLIILTIGYMYAVFAGYIGEPNVSRLWTSVAIVAGFALYAFAYVRWFKWVGRETDVNLRIGKSQMYFPLTLILLALVVKTAHSLYQLWRS